MKLVVVGGVAAGMSIAARARRLDEHAQIVVLERGAHVSFANCGLPYHVGEVIADRSRLLLQTPQSLAESLDLDVRTGVEVLAIDREAKTVRARDLATGREYDEPYDTLALTPGAEPVRPPLPGIDLPGVHVLRRIGDMDRIKADVDGVTDGPPARHAVVIGAGYIGLEMAENLHARGVAVEVVEMTDQVLPALDREMTTTVENHLRAHGVALHLGTAAAAFTTGRERRLRVELKNHTVVETDLVVLAAGVRPATALAVDAGLELGPRGGIKVDARLRTSDPSIYAAGDAVEVEHAALPGTWLIPLAGPANRQGRVAADNICGRDTTFSDVQATSVVKVFDMVAGGTGATEKQLREAGIDHHVAHTHPHGHAGYYPGTSMMHLKVLFAPGTGQILGAQIAGFDGVDKRLDVLATAMRAGMTVTALQDLELAYAPPFGSAKDPVNMIGFVASNVLAGDLQLWHAPDYPDAVDGARIIDVRGPDEYDVWHIPGAENVPLKDLRAAAEQWDRDTPIRLYCAVGFRSYLAYRSLVQRGFADVRTLSGGSATFRAHHHVTPSELDAPTPAISYAENHADPAPAEGAGTVVDLDCTGLACPGPIMKLQQTVAGLAPGDEVVAHVSDPGFALDAPAWATRNGHTLVSLTPEGPGYAARVRKGGGSGGPVRDVAAGPVPPAAARLTDKKSFVVFSGDMDKVVAAFILANGAVAMGDEVSMFFTFWGLNSLRRQDPPRRKRPLMHRMFAMMMPSGASRLPLSTMNMAGAGPALIKSVMRKNNVASLPALIASAQEGGVRLVGCTMTMELLGIAQEDLIDGVELGGVATFLGEANESNGAFFI
ncbi:FAD-dependent oxidoreductase [Cellulomonas bogoriensis]|uniref:Pyridine nucleotide-disulfide oxidoreductase n=1 Tax=Cellulomonas bogoriensis 69B4 = DSM 16987 TaxID=1386082 RepID=A0A0A0C0H3_9CELL|nr:FAD-dependent oxidoreductase [Cellulomonas bogoriensis]KGM12919.1 pyridine nucleotide-disulfide oxidoreductase [Cellulomonas bogoriensis 69B4 = DSM 16987]